jgi:hypothetical protein
MHMHPDDEKALSEAFHGLVNMSPGELEAWLATPQSRRVGMVRRGERESVGHRSGRRILQILETPAGELTQADHAHMRKVIGFCRRHLAQRPGGDVTDTRWRWSLMNWGHDPLKR